MLTVLGLVFNVIGTLFVAKYTRPSVAPDSKGNEPFFVNPGDSDKLLFTYSENILLNSIGWCLIGLGFVLQLVDQIIPLFKQ